MRPDFAAVRAGQLAYGDAIRDLDHAALVALTDDYYDEFEAIIAGATDAATVTVPFDPALEDQTAGEGAFTLAHVVAHLTASSEEGGAIASAVARGVELPEGLRLRAEAPWQEITTIEQVRARLAESRRMCRASLDMWPDAPDLDLAIVRIPRFGPMNAVALYALGLFHADSHLDQLREIMRQMREQGKAEGATSDERDAPATTGRATNG